MQEINTASKKQIFRLKLYSVDDDNYWCTISTEPGVDLVWEIENENDHGNDKRLILAKRTDRKNQRFSLNNSDLYY